MPSRPRQGCHGNAEKVRAKKNLGQHFLKSTDIARVIARCVHAGYVPALMPDGSLDRLLAGSLRSDAAEFYTASGSVPLQNPEPLPAVPSGGVRPGGRESASPVGAVAPSLFPSGKKIHVLEIGPGMGVLSRCLWEDPGLDVRMVELDPESVVYLATHFPERTSDGRLIPADFLRMDLRSLFDGEEFVLTGNFPYNISSQILFRLLENRDRIPILYGMFQKEVGERVCAVPGSKAYGILSVLLQAFYTPRYLFTVEPEEFLPPPQVRSCVIRLVRNGQQQLGCDEALFAAVVKKAFNQRRKTLRNALKDWEKEFPVRNLPSEYLDKRAEQLGVEDYVKIVLHLKDM